MTASKELRDAWRDRQEARNLCSFRYQGTTFFLRKIAFPTTVRKLRDDYFRLTLEPHAEVATGRTGPRTRPMPDVVVKDDNGRPDLESLQNAADSVIAWTVMKE